jgi:hypothetical protein
LASNAWAKEIESNTLPETDPALNSDAAPDNVPTQASYSDATPYPSTSQPISTNVRPYTLPKHHFLEGSIYHPNPPAEDGSFTVDEAHKVVKISGSHELYAFKDWAQEKFFDAKFETLNKRFEAIEKKQAELDKRLAELESTARPNQPQS